METQYAESSVTDDAFIGNRNETTHNRQHSPDSYSECDEYILIAESYSGTVTSTRDYCSKQTSDVVETHHKVIIEKHQSAGNKITRTRSCSNRRSSQDLPLEGNSRPFERIIIQIDKRRPGTTRSVRIGKRKQKNKDDSSRGLSDERQDLLQGSHRDTLLGLFGGSLRELSEFYFKGVHGDILRALFRGPSRELSNERDVFARRARPETLLRLSSHLSRRQSDEKGSKFSKSSRSLFSERCTCESAKKFAETARAFSLEKIDDPVLIVRDFFNLLRRGLSAEGLGHRREATRSFYSRFPRGLSAEGLGAYGKTPRRFFSERGSRNSSVDRLSRSGSLDLINKNWAYLFSAKNKKCAISVSRGIGDRIRGVGSRDGALAMTRGGHVRHIDCTKFMLVLAITRRRKSKAVRVSNKDLAPLFRNMRITHEVDDTVGRALARVVTYIRYSERRSAIRHRRYVTVYLNYEVDAQASLSSKRSMRPSATDAAGNINGRK